MKRRQLLPILAATLGSAPLWSHAQGFEASPWRGPLGAFSLPDTTGKTWTPADFKGRAVLLNFWASWCEPCRTEMPSLQTLADLHGPDKLVVLVINFKEPAQRALRFAQASGVSLPVLLDAEGLQARQWGVKVFPSTFLIDRQGRPRQRIRGELDWSGPQAGKLVDALLA